MPVAEAGSYELAFHVLPTVAEGEVANVFQSLKDMITKKGGEITIEEAPSRFDLAYEIIKYLEGRNRKFTSSYFGWVRFTISPDKIEEIDAKAEGMNELLRHILIKLTKIEEENPFMFHESLDKHKTETINLDEEDSEEESSENEDSDEEAPDPEEDSVEDGEESEEKV